MDKSEMIRIIRGYVEAEVGDDPELNTKIFQTLDKLMQGFAAMVFVTGGQYTGPPVVGVAFTLGAILSSSRPEIAQMYKDLMTKSKYGNSMEFILDTVITLYDQWTGETTATPPSTQQNDVAVPDFMTNIKDWNF